MQAIVERDPCSYCGARREDWKPTLGADHIVALSRGGEASSINMTGCCSQCNSSKHDVDLLRFLLYRLTGDHRWR